jgi:hypothetical protein
MEHKTNPGFSPDWTQAVSYIVVIAVTLSALAAVFAVVVH